jgi:cellulose synthase/poly-beta-1,6-N-acetylglucosamine synthase-like glycosyltransferase
MLVERGFMTKDDKGVYKMKDLKNIMDATVPEANIPKNILHLWQVTTWDLGLEDDILKGRRMHISFAVKHRNDGKINSHKWFF